MNNYQLAEMAYKAATKFKTLYVTGGQGQPLRNDEVKQMFIDRYQSNKVNRKDAIMSASPDTFAFDCNGLIKAIINGWYGNTELPRGGSVYDSVIPDITCEAMIKSCSDVSVNFNTLEIGELLYMSGHVGVVVSVSPPLAVEATSKWDADVQVTSINKFVAGYQQRNWTKHGKMKEWITYGIETDCSVPCQKLQEGSEGPYVITAQRLLQAAGADPGGIDGKFGPKTAQAVRNFQKKHKDIYGEPLEQDGKIFELTWGALMRGEI